MHFRAGRLPSTSTSKIWHTYCVYCMLRNSTWPNTSRNYNPCISKSHLFPNVRSSKHSHEKQWSVIVWEKYFLPRRNAWETRGSYLYLKKIKKIKKNQICIQVILSDLIKNSHSETEMLANFVSRLKRCGYRQSYNHSHTARQFRVQNISDKFIFTALTAFRLLWRAKGKIGLLRQMSKDTSRYPSCLKIQP